MRRTVFAFILLAFISLTSSSTQHAPSCSDNVATQKYFAKTHAQLADYFRTIETYFISVLTVGNQRLNKVDENLEKVLQLLNQLRSNQGVISTEKEAPGAGEPTNLVLTDDQEIIKPPKLVSVEEDAEIPDYESPLGNETMEAPTNQTEEETELVLEEKQVNHNYYFSEEVNTWYAAEEFCESLNLTLASIKSEAEIRLLWDLLPHKGECYWTGGSDFGRVPGQFHWRDRDGSPGERVEQRFWGVGQPSNYDKHSSTCIVICGKKLFDFSCLDSVNYFICKNID